MPSLNGPRARIIRAKSQLVALNESFNQFFKLNTYRVIKAEFNRKAGHYALRVSDKCPIPPIEWGIIVGEIAHNLRSALDGLTWQIALLNTTIIPYQHTAFPICLLPHGKKPRIDGGYYHPFWINGKPTHLLKSIDRRYWTRIEAFQPYQRGNGGRHSPLFLLDELNNTDKHRLITVLVVTVRGMVIMGLSGGTHINIGVPLHPNAKVGYVMPLPQNGIEVLDFKSGKPYIRIEYDVQVNTLITPGICFGNSCNAVKRLPVIRTLASISNEVSRIIESFAKES